MKKYIVWMGILIFTAMTASAGDFKPQSVTTIGDSPQTRLEDNSKCELKLAGSTKWGGEGKKVRRIEPIKVQRRPQ